MRNSYIDSLKGLSVILVFLYHTDLLKIGYVGVEIFFCISGFLITLSIINNNLTVKEFFLRRVRRLAFPIIIVMAFNFVAILYLTPDPEIIQFLKHGIFSLLFLENFYLLYSSGYFTISNEFNPFGHFWSLSIEEQFYLFFVPLLIFLKYKIKINILILILMLFFSIIELLEIYYGLDSKYIYLLSTNRFWQFLVGVYLAFNINFFYNLIKINHYLKFSIINIIFLVLIFISVIGFNIENQFFWLIQSFFISLIVFIFIFLSLQLNFNFKIYSFFAFFGEISYGFYLYHYPLIVFYKWNGGIINFYSIISIFVICLLLSFFSYKFIEKKLINYHQSINA